MLIELCYYCNHLFCYGLQFMKKTYWCKSALLTDGWAKSVTIEVDNDGNISAIKIDQQPESFVKLDAVIPGVPNLHSHAHQRAMSGLGEKAGANKDSFWTWRVAMYHYLERIQPEDLYHIAKMLYLEMLKSGYTNVAEFQYLHHDRNGKAFDNRAEMTLQCQQAAVDVGIGFTALPVLYNHGGFGGQPPIEGQKRFLNNAEGFLEIVSSIQQKQVNNLNVSVGIAPHSLRAVTGDLLHEVLDALSANKPVTHIHIAEQLKEVSDCVSWSGRRPVEWLFENFNVDERWCLIHATHMTQEETRSLATSGAIAGLCPTTEANLGDGFFNMVQYGNERGHWGIGSDSHISISPVEELRWLEYGQRLLTNERNVLSEDTSPHTGQTLLTAALKGGASACDRAIGKIAVGKRADFTVLDSSHPRLYGREAEQLIDSWIFSGNENCVSHVFVGGDCNVADGHHKDELTISDNYRNTIDLLANR